MHAVSIETLRAGDVMARPLVDESGHILLHQGVRLSEAYIQALRDKGYERLYVRDEIDDDVDVAVEEDISPALRSRAITTMRRAFDQIGTELSALRKLSLDDATKALESKRVKVLVSSTGPLAQVPKLVGSLFDEVLTRDTLAGLTSMKGSDSKLYDHSIDVCVVAIMIGRAVELPNVRMRQLATGCLLHDIGMLFVPEDVDEAKRIRIHTTLGYELLRQSDDPDILAPYVAYEHHEHQDGSGLPRGLVGSNRLDRNRGTGTPVPTVIGEIAAVANEYDNLLSGAHGRSPMAPDAAIADITERANTHFNLEVVRAFRRVVPVYPVGTQVVLHGQPYHRFLGVVSAADLRRLDRPKVVLVRDAKRQPIQPLEVDTANFPDMRIQTLGF